ncbi:HD domain-containing protein [Janibacter terrae]|uniref:HD domain-containing protein n=1 Tax=Janibacter terrae TaxID=103817 RepID=UPI0008390C00|nr:HD domain-containing protein [Janibacter terrae]
MADVDEAKRLAKHFVEPLGRRWLHVQSVAACAADVAARAHLTEDLVAAAWLHDIGYADELHDTGFHPIDGARYLRRAGWPEQIVSLVAHHTCARLEANLRGLGEQLEAFSRPEAAYEDALAFCDITNGPAGDRVTPVERMAEIQDRYGPEHLVTRFVDVARGSILGAVDRTTARLAVPN